MPIAYFCAEYGLHHSIPVYAGGLGFLAGDILKESSDMDLPVIGIGFMYPHGYIRQVIGPDGWQNGLSEPVDRDAAPIERVLDKNLNHMILEVPYITPKVYVAVWKVNVGRISLYLLDTDIEQNDPWDRHISSKLYTADLNQRLRQEIVLGIGGCRVLRALGIEYFILHLNEGHPAFALLERMRKLIEEGHDFENARKIVEDSSIFTTHTSLQAATDVYSYDLMRRYFSKFVQDMKIDMEKLMSMGINPDNPSSGFNMTALAIKVCRYTNAVSKKHKDVANEIWKTLLKGKKIDYVTNGVHILSWQNNKLKEKEDFIFSRDWSDICDNKDLWEKIEDIDDACIWNIHRRYKAKLINHAREKVRRKWAEEKIDPSIAMAEGVMLDPNVLTIVFARRFTKYKRPELILHDIQRLEKIVNNPSMPVQIIFTGKAHPADTEGKKILQKVFQIAMSPMFKGRIAFIEDYGELCAKILTKGVDVWLNTPFPPLEACGTSGMKAALNGVLHLSIADGWWLEGYNTKNGWSIEGKSDKEDAEKLYNILENEIVPMYYDRDNNNIPKKWIKMMKESIKSISPMFSSRRMMKDYLDKFYIPITKEISNINPYSNF